MLLLLHSRKFLVLVLDTVISLILFYATKTLAPASLNDIKELIAILQPLFLTMIYSVAKEDAAEKANVWNDPGLVAENDELRAELTAQNL